jgi:hypothetical protein
LFILHWLRSRGRTSLSCIIEEESPREISYGVVRMWMRGILYWFCTNTIEFVSNSGWLITLIRTPNLVSPMNGTVSTLNVGLISLT